MGEGITTCPVWFSLSREQHGRPSMAPSPPGISEVYLPQTWSTVSAHGGLSAFPHSDSVSPTLHILPL